MFGRMSYAEYRGNLTPYRVNGNINVADGAILKYPQFGKEDVFFTKIFDLTGESKNIKIL